MGDMTDKYNILVGKPEGKRPLGRTRRRCDGNVRMTLRENGCEVVDWTRLGQDSNQWRARENTEMNLRVP